MLFCYLTRSKYIAIGRVVANNQMPKIVEKVTDLLLYWSMIENYGRKAFE